MLSRGPVEFIQPGSFSFPIPAKAGIPLPTVIASEARQSQGRVFSVFRIFLILDT
jgi:hypothetical protein